MLSIKQCYTILELEQGASLDEVKTAYRRLAFELHPDLNPKLTDAGVRFHNLNQAYVTLSRHLSENKTAQQKKAPKESFHSKSSASEAYQKAQKASPKKESQQAGAAYSKKTESKSASSKKLLHDILQDDFARRVYEDIYSHIGTETRKKSHEEKQNSASHFREASKNSSKIPTQTIIDLTAQNSESAKSEKTASLLGKLSYWVKKQIDEEQTVYLPRQSLTPGSKIRLHIQHGFLGKAQAVEFILPPEFSPEKPIRLRGLGKKIGSWTGDLYVRLSPPQP